MAFGDKGYVKRVSDEVDQGSHPFRWVVSKAAVKRHQHDAWPLMIKVMSNMYQMRQTKAHINFGGLFRTCLR